MLKRKLPWILLCVVALGAATILVPNFRAQDGPNVKWRTDYNAARKEAAERKLPLLIDFVRPNCAPCARMEQITFRDPRVAAMLNDRFVPLKIDGTVEVQLAATLNINLYPTIVLANSNGQITQSLIGYQEADVMNEYMVKLAGPLAPALAPMLPLTPVPLTPSIDLMQKNLELAVRSESTGDFERAVSLARTVMDEAKTPALRQDAQGLIAKIEKIAASRLAEARELHSKGQSGEALESLAQLQKQFLGTQAARDASDSITQITQANAQLKADFRSKRARDLLTQAQGFHKTKDYIPCLDRIEIILANFGDLAEGQSAFILATEIKNNREWLQNAADVMADRLGGMWLTLAESHLKSAEVSRAQFNLNRVIQAFPGTRVAESAQLRLNQIESINPKTKELRAGQ